jgi:GDP-4-dehydro-6-deoxy-D-mannose reductase
MSKILITGANGFVAKYLKDLFKKDEVFLTDLAGDQVIKCDITDKQAIYDLIHTTCPDEIYHLAAIALPSMKDRDLVYNVNVNGTLNLLEAAREFCPKAKILLVSSGYVYGNCKTPAKETDPTSPEGIYAQSKLEMERQALEKFSTLNIYIARPFTHSGKGQSLGFFFPDMAKKIGEAKKETSPIIEVFNPESKRDFSHVKDVVSAYKLILEKGKTGEIYNVCSNKFYDILDTFEKIAKQAGLKNYKVKKIKHGIVLNLLGNNSKIKKLGFKPKYGTDKIIKEFITK